MGNFTLIFDSRIVTALLSVAVVAWPSAALAQATVRESAGMPDFGGSWTRDGPTPSTFDPAPSGPSVIVTAVPHFGHCVIHPEGVETDFPCPEGVEENRESNAWIADYTNPVLQPWTREALKKNADGESVGISHMSFQQNCKPSGVPQILNLRYEVQFLQAQDQVTILYENNQQVRRVYMNQQHPDQLTPSWYGQSIGHYEGDTLVIDTIGQFDFTELDRFGTLHSEALRVVERYRMVDQNTLQAVFTIEDQKAYTMPFRGVATYRRTDFPFPEFVCAENNRPTHPNQVFDIPTDTTPDF